MKTFFYSGQYIPIHEGNIEDYDELNINEIYNYNGQYYIYYGKQKDQSKPGLYLDEDEEGMTLVDYKKNDYSFNEEDIIELEENEENNIFDVKKDPHINEEPEEEKPKKEPKEKIKRKSVTRERKYNRDDILYLEVKLEDSDMVRLIKEKLNERKITLDYIYKLEGNANGYNLFYGLQTRNNLRWDAFLKWCDILEVEPVLSLIDKKK